MIAIVTKDGTNKKKTMEVAEVIGNLGISKSMIYKLDVYSALGLFRSNAHLYGLKPTLYKYTH
jgi:hypothetical protein